MDKAIPTTLVKRFSFFLAVLVFSFSCRTISQKQFVSPEKHGTGHILHDSIERSYLFFVPSSNNFARHPILIVLHGGGGSGEGMVYLTRFSDYAKDHEFIVIYPNGFKNRWNDGRNLKTETDLKKTDDVGFILKIVNSIVEHYNGDPNRVYITGLSNGGFMSYRFLCEESNRISGIAPVAAGISIPLSEKCNIQNPKPFLLVQGKKDQVVPYSGGEVNTIFGKMGFTLSHDATMDFILQKYGCKEFVQDVIPVLKGSGMIDRRKGVDCRNSVRVESLSLPESGHIWPHGWYYKSKLDYGYLSNDLDATKTILDFFHISAKPQKQLGYHLEK